MYSRKIDMKTNNKKIENKDQPIILLTSSNMKAIEQTSFQLSKAAELQSLLTDSIGKIFCRKTFVQNGKCRSAFNVL